MSTGIEGDAKTIAERLDIGMQFAMSRGGCFVRFGSLALKHDFSTPFNAESRRGQSDISEFTMIPRF